MLEYIKTFLQEPSSSRWDRVNERKTRPIHKAWKERGSNPRPLVCKTNALPTELSSLSLTAGTWLRSRLSCSRSSLLLFAGFAEGKGFEPLSSAEPSAFKADAFNHSANLPSLPFG